MNAPLKFCMASALALVTAMPAFAQPQPYQPDYPRETPYQQPAPSPQDSPAPTAYQGPPQA